MDERLKRRVVGAVVLVVAAVVFVPMVLDQGSEAPPQPTRSIPSTSPLPPPTPPLAPENTDVRVVPLESPVTPPPAEPPKPAKIAKPAPPSKEKAPAKVASKPAAPKPAANAGFAVQLGSFSKAGNAVGLRDKLNAKGYKAFVKISGSVSRVYVGPQKNRAEAHKALEKLLADTKMKGIVVGYPG